MKIGFVSMPLSGHLNPMTALARRLQSRGNEVVFFGVPDVEPFARAADLDFVPYGEAEYPVGSIDKLYSSVATMRGFEVVRHSCMDLNLDLTRAAFDYLCLGSSNVQKHFDIQPWSDRGYSDGSGRSGRTVPAFRGRTIRIARRRIECHRNASRSKESV